MHEVVALELELVVFFPVTANRQNLVSAAHNRNHVRQCDPCRLAIILVLKPGQVQVNVHFVELKPIVVRCREPSLSVFLFLNICLELLWLPQLYVAVEPSLHQLDQLVLGLAHTVCQSIARS